MSSALTLVLGLGGIAVASQAGKESADAERRESGKIATETDYVRAKLPSLSRITWAGGDGVPAPGVIGHRMESHTSYPREVLDRAEARMKAEWDKLNGSAKREVCKRMKAEFPGDENIQQLSCDEPLWEELVRVSLVASAAAGGTALCGPACGAVAGSLAAVVGVKATDWMAGAYDDLSAEAKKLWEESGEWIEESWGEATDYAKDLIRSADPREWVP